MTAWGIVLAAGAGTRFGEAKQFVHLRGRRLVDRAVAMAAAACAGVVVVLPPPPRTWDGPAVSAVVTGGPDRAASVRAGLAAVPDAAEVILVHDAAHPLATADTARAVLSAVTQGAAAAIPGVAPTEVVKRVLGDGHLSTIGRDGLVLAQMPQAFRASALRMAHARAAPAGVLEDSALVEALGERVVVVPGDRRNVHVVDRTTLAVAEALAEAVP